MEWQLIETAPKDGTQVLVCRVYENGRVEYAVAHRYQDGDEWRDIGDIGWAGMYGDDNQPTHWIPLPEAPNDKAQGEAQGLSRLSPGATGSATTAKEVT